MARPIIDNAALKPAATLAMEAFVAEIQAGLDAADADLYDKHFASDVKWGSPYGRTIDGFQPLTAIHHSLMAKGVAPKSRYEIVHLLSPTPGVAVAHVRRQALSDNGTGFSEMALYVLVERDGQWWLVAGQNTPITDPPAAQS